MVLLNKWLKRSSFATQHMFANNSELCAVMSISNSKYPEWFLLHCSQKVWVDVVCAHTTGKGSLEIHHKYNNSSVNLSSLSLCTTTQIVYGGYCYEFMDSVSSKKHMKPVSMADLSALTDIMRCFTKYQEKTIVFNYQTGNTQLIKFGKIRLISFDKVKNTFESFIPEAPDSQKFFILNIKKYPVQHTRQHFEIQLEECQTGELVSVVGLSLGQNTCKVNDESMLFSKECFSQGKFFKQIWLKQDCPKLSYKTAGELCCPFVSRHRLTIGPLTGAMSPSEITRFNNASQKLGSIFMDCTTDEIRQFEDNIIPSQTGCLKPGEIQCTPGCAPCFPVFKLCVFELDFSRKSMHCPSGAHLKHCDEFECSNMLKCHHSYCVPFRYNCFCFSFAHILQKNYKDILVFFMADIVLASGMCVTTFGSVLLVMMNTKQFARAGIVQDSSSAFKSLKCAYI